VPVAPAATITAKNTIERVLVKVRKLVLDVLILRPVHIELVWLPILSCMQACSAIYLYLVIYKASYANLRTDQTSSNLISYYVRFGHIN
jgi:hypothetical protein